MTTTFEDAKIGDRAWCIRSGWGEIRDAGSPDRYAIAVYFPNAEYKRYTSDGFYNEDDATRSLFWDEVVIEAPTKPLPTLKVDAKVLVWMDGSSNKYCRHFSHFKNDYIYVFDKGLSSWTGISKSAWDHWELVE